MNFDKEAKSEVFFFFFFFFLGGGGGGGGGGGQRGRFQPKKNHKKKNNRYSLIFVLMLYIKFQVPCSSGSLVLTQTKGVTDR